jgi:putative colanic acid biosysnthesis UDP-glucose lipid carrier transferase
MSLQSERVATPYRVVAPRRKKFDHDAIAYLAAACDFLIVLGANVVSAVGYQQVVFGVYPDPGKYFGIGLVMGALFTLAMGAARAYRHESLISIRHQALLIVLLIPGILAFLLTVIFFLKTGTTFSRGAILSFALISTTSLASTRLIWRHHLPQAIAQGMFGKRRVLLVCPQDRSVEAIQSLSVSSGITISHVAKVNDDGRPIVDFCRGILQSNALTHIQEVVVLWESTRNAELEAILREFRCLPLPIKVVFDSFTGSIASCPSESIAGMTAFQVQRPPLTAMERLLKRGFDVSFALLALLMLSPLMIMIALLIKLDSKGPVFFRQTRRGCNGQPFHILKFRSMTVMENGATIRQATVNDPRVTRMGRFIRTTSIDELPQFWNVLRSEMSVVGPRPHAIAHDDQYGALITDYASRRHVKPGLTGWAQINGYRGETASVEIMEHRVAHDLWYIDNWSLLLDVEITLRTAFKLRSQV